jgi:hypothetical protein
MKVAVGSIDEVGGSGRRRKRLRCQECPAGATVVGY